MKFQSYLFFLVSVFLSISTQSAYANQKISGTVTAVITGDIIIVKDKLMKSHRIRLGGIDAPETRQPYWYSAKKFLASNFQNQPVTVIVVGTDYKKQKVGFVFYEGMNINHFMVATGNAWALRRAKRGVNYTEAERSARNNKDGIWSLPKERIMRPSLWAKKN